ncbi:MAG: hypothetical protein AB7G11_17890 [Phycisphaerales bacterium]
MNELDIQETLLCVIENLIDARDEIEGEDDDIALADIARDLVENIDDIISVTTFERAMLMTPDKGVVVRTSSGDVFHISIAQSRRGNCAPAASDEGTAE